jgi:hypothetical protein
MTFGIAHACQGTRKRVGADWMCVR